ncbi:MAG: hypothetical protein IJ297_01390 [Clostridia bacterium]|nr:hypothetical protein [Clostridia bacterium]
MTKKINSIIAIILVCAIAVVFVNFFREENSPYVKYTARVGTYVVSTEADALVVREEYIIEPDLTGVMEPSVSEGERVSAYSRLGAVITGDIDPGKVNELNALNHEIDTLTATLSEAGILTIADDKVDSTLDLSLGNLRYASAKNDTGSAVLQAENVKILSERKAGITSSSIAQVRLGDATAQRDAIAASLGGAHKAIYAPMAGLYSDNMDGLEETLTVGVVNSITPQLIDDAFTQLGNTTPKGLCKIVNNYKWYIVFNLSQEDCRGLSVGNSYTVNFKQLNETYMTGTVKYISPADENGKCAVSMQFDKHIDNFTSIRETKVEICKETYTGIYIPRNAVTVNGVQGVWVQNEVSLDFRSIEEVYRSDDFLLVKENAPGQGGHSNIALYDNIVLNPDK